MESKELMVAIGKADACEVFKNVFSFPDEVLVAALLDGSVMADLAASMTESGCGIDESRALHKPGYSLCELRTAYTKLYSSPKGPLVFPYESAFLHIEAHREGIPVLFRSAVTLDVEAQMREASVIPKNARKEPCDSVFQELEFLSYLYGSLASTIQRKDDASEEMFRSRISTFLDTHALRWMPLFMKRTADLCIDPYSFFAEEASVFLESLEKDVFA